MNRTLMMEHALELSGEYMLMGAKATERDVIRHEGPDKYVIESWMSFAGSEEFKEAEMVLTRSKQTLKSENKTAEGESHLRLGNFSVSLAVKDLSASLAFYEKLGFSVIAGNKRNYDPDGSQILIDQHVSSPKK